MSAEIEAYQQALAELKAASVAAERVAVIVGRGGTALKDWPRAMVANSAGGFPPEIGLTREAHRIIDAREWPTGQQIADALQAYHAAKLKVQNAYARVPESMRGVVKAPPG